MPRSSIKNEKMYQELRKQGDSKEKAARISNAAAGRGKSSVGRKGGKSGSYADWTVPGARSAIEERAWHNPSDALAPLDEHGVARRRDPKHDRPTAVLRADAHGQAGIRGRTIAFHAAQRAASGDATFCRRLCERGSAGPWSNDRA